MQLPCPWITTHQTGGGGCDCGLLNMIFFVCFVLLLFLFSLKTSPEGYIIYRIVNCFHDMKIMSLRNGGGFGKQLVLQTGCLPNHHHSFLT